MENKSNDCGALGPNKTGCNREEGHPGLHHEPKLNTPGGNFWTGEYRVQYNRRSVWGTGGS